jgi:glycosyltransferase involved in cell wall biosynthesis
MMPDPSRSDALRVLVIAPTPFFADRGCHVRIYEQCRALVGAGHEVVVCTYPLGRDIDGLDIRRTVPVPWYTKLSAGPSVHKIYIDALLMMTVARECLRRRPDVIHAHLHEGVLLGRVAAAMFRVPLVADLQGSLALELVQHDFVRVDGPLHRFFHRVERVLNRLPHRALVSSRHTLETLAGMEGAPNEKVVVLPDGVDPSRFHVDPEGGAAVRERLGIGPEESVVGFLGVLTEYQGVSVLLNAARRVLQRLPSVRFLVMGYPDEDRYRRKAEEMGIGAQVIFTGRVPYDEARAYLAACDLAVSPKLSTTEANGKLLNYIAVGLPVIASDTPVNREILDGAGILTPPGDDEALAAAIERVLLSPEQRERLRALAVARAEQLSWRQLGKQLVEIYRNAIHLHTRVRRGTGSSRAANTF